MDLKIHSLESEAGFKALFRHASIAIMVISKDGTIELLNPCAEKLFNYQAAELTGKPLEVLIPAALREKHKHHRNQFFEKPKPRSMGYGLDLYAIKKDGTEFPAEISLGHYELEGEKLAVAFITDISERRNLEKQVIQSNEDLEKKLKIRTLEITKLLEKEREINEMKSRLVSFASHEFRTPLSTILSSASLIEQYNDVSHEEKRHRHIERIKLSVKHLTEILNDFLSLDKLDQGSIISESAMFNLMEFLNVIFEEMEGMLNKKSQQIKLDYTGTGVILQDPKIIRHIMLNLLSNAVKYSPEGSVISVTVAAEEDKVSISVTDPGIGIPADDQEHLFDKFFRAGNARDIQGTGLGLYIVKKYVELINGEISYTSDINKGTTFTILFALNNK